MIVLPAAVRSREKGRRGDEVVEMDEMKEMVEVDEMDEMKEMVEMDKMVEVVEMYKMVEVVEMDEMFENSCFLVFRQINYKIQVEF